MHGSVRTQTPIGSWRVYASFVWSGWRGEARQCSIPWVILYRTHLYCLAMVLVCPSREVAQCCNDRTPNFISLYFQEMLACREYQNADGGVTLS